MIVMKYGLIDYTQTSFLIEAFALGKSGISKEDFADFQGAVCIHDDGTIFRILAKYSHTIAYYFDIDTKINEIELMDKGGNI